MRRIHTAIIVVVGLLCVSTLRAQDLPASARTHRMLIVSVDGLRPDLLLRANTPHMHALFKRGTFTFWARSTEVSVTLPSHTSMVTGVTPKRHGITFNNDGPEEPVYPDVPTVFELAHRAGYSTALVSGKSKFSILARPGTVDFLHVPQRGRGAGDEAVGQASIEIIKAHRPQLLMVHFPGPDAVGHREGWGTDAQIQTIEKVDEMLGDILDALGSAGVLDQTIILLTADHGGTGKWHGPNDPRARHIPWIVAGAGIRQNFDLTTLRELTVNIEDTFATACWMLGVEFPADLDGKPIEAILVDPQAPVPETPARNAQTVPQ